MIHTTISGWGNSQGVRLPQTVLDAARIKRGDSVELIPCDGNIVIKRTAAGNRAAHVHKTIQERFAGYTGDYKAEEIDWGKPVGDEIW
jgi:antitoxin MazE